MNTPSNIAAQTLCTAERIRDGMIGAARALADRDCGALQSEMRTAQIEYLAAELTAIAKATGQ